MGGGGNMSTPTTKAEQRKTPLPRAPTEKPPFTIGDIKKAIPPHCFKRSPIRSFYYVAKDLLLVYVFYYIASTYFHLLPSPYQYLAWPIYWVLQGCVFNGIWMLSHECGHNAMTDYPWLDDTLGFFLHSSVLVPYFSFKYSHRRHHANTNSLERDEVYVPRVKSRLQWFYNFSNNPVGRMLPIVLTLTIGWPMYAAFNYLGRDYDSFASHYNPYGPIYNARERFWIFVSDAGVLATVYGLYRAALAKGLVWVVCIYGVPILVMNFFLILLTYLHHTHPSIPHYDASEWEWLRGALSTVDRDYGVLNKVFHNITDTHVLHHLISSIPHYNAMEATEAIKPLLGKYYQFDGTPWYKAIWRDAGECVYVEKDDKGIYWFKNKF